MTDCVSLAICKEAVIDISTNQLSLIQIVETVAVAGLPTTLAGLNVVAQFIVSEPDRGRKFEARVYSELVDQPGERVRTSNAVEFESVTQKARLILRGGVNLTVAGSLQYGVEFRRVGRKRWRRGSACTFLDVSVRPMQATDDESAGMVSEDAG